MQGMYQKLPFNSHFQLDRPACCVRRTAQDLGNFMAPSPLQVLSHIPSWLPVDPRILKNTNPPGSACKAKFPRQLRPFHLHCGIPGPSPTAVPSKLISGPRALVAGLWHGAGGSSCVLASWLGATPSGPTADFPLPISLPQATRRFSKLQKRVTQVAPLRLKDGISCTCFWQV